MALVSHAVVRLTLACSTREFMKDTVDTMNVGDPDGVRLTPIKHENVTLDDTTANKEDPDNVKHLQQLESPPKICGCSCAVSCNCACACADHCVCRGKPCKGNCGARFSRNLVISIDGTSNQFGIHVSICADNMELFSLRSEHQRRRASWSH
jgi:hypothetical protein